jgi:hypothetical protein
MRSNSHVKRAPDWVVEQSLLRTGRELLASVLAGLWLRLRLQSS